MKHLYLSYLFLFISSSSYLWGQSAIYFDGFETSSALTWVGDDCVITPSVANPQLSSVNYSAKVLKYQDEGALYANVRLQVPTPFDLSKHKFSFKLYIPSTGITGNQSPKVSLKVQNGTLAAPWQTQSEIKKTIVYDAWQLVEFNFATDSYFNLDPNSLPPTQRTDFNRMVIQINGENNTDKVTAYVDDFKYEESNVSPAPTGGYQLIWKDEFEGTGSVNADNWFAQTQLPAGNSWYNGEIQHYTHRVENAYVQDGNLHIKAIKESFSDQGVVKNYTSARLNSKTAFKYGRVEVRAKLPSGVGTWPAFWLLGKDVNEPGAYWQILGHGTTNWPQCGEIDLMEHWGQNQNYVQSALHTPSSFGNTTNLGGLNLPTASTAFHVYAMNWTKDKIDFFVDDRLYYTYNPAIKNANTWPFDREMYMLLNLAILPNINPQISSAEIEIDYVRVYQQGVLANDTEIPNKPNLNVYPNPFSNHITLSLPYNMSGAYTFQIYAIDGRLLVENRGEAFSQELKMEGLGVFPKGFYLLRLTSGNQVYHAQLIK